MDNNVNYNAIITQIHETDDLKARHFEESDIGQIVFSDSRNKGILSKDAYNRYKKTILILYKSGTRRIDKTHRDTFAELDFKSKDCIELRVSETLDTWMKLAGYKRACDPVVGWDLKYVYHFDKDDIDTAIAAVNMLIDKAFA